jgi:hypothetical protein
VCRLAANRRRLRGGRDRKRGLVIEQTTGRPVQFEITEKARQSIATWLACRGENLSDWRFPSRMPAGRYYPSILAAAQAMDQAHRPEAVRTWGTDAGVIDA